MLRIPKINLYFFFRKFPNRMDRNAREQTALWAAPLIGTATEAYAATATGRPQRRLVSTRARAVLRYDEKLRAKTSKNQS